MGNPYRITWKIDKISKINAKFRLKAEQDYAFVKLSCHATDVSIKLIKNADLSNEKKTRSVKTRTFLMNLCLSPP